MSNIPYFICTLRNINGCFYNDVYSIIEKKTGICEIENYNDVYFDLAKTLLLERIKDFIIGKYKQLKSLGWNISVDEY